MKNKTWVAVLLLAAVLGASVYVPIRLSGYEDRRLLREVKTEKLSRSAKPEKSQQDTLENLSVISRARRMGSEIVSGKVTYNTADKKLVKLVGNGLEKLLQSGIVTGEGLNYDIKILEAVKLYYTQTDGQKKVRCYYIEMQCSGSGLWLLMDEETELIYEISIEPEIGTELNGAGAAVRLTENAQDKWAEYLGITLKKMSAQPMENIVVYETEDADVFYMFTRPEYIEGNYISIADSFSLGYSEDDANTMREGSSIDAVR